MFSALVRLQRGRQLFSIYSGCEGPSVVLCICQAVKGPSVVLCICQAVKGPSVVLCLSQATRGRQLFSAFVRL